MPRLRQRWTGRTDYVRVRRPKRGKRGHAYCMHDENGEVRIVRIHCNPHESTRRRNHFYDTGVRRVVTRTDRDESLNWAMIRKRFDVPTTLN